jgi:glycosyltransferase involved in cell wall biosynthesis
VDAKKMKTVVLITNIPTPYRVPLFGAVASMLESQGIRLHVVFCEKTYARRQFQLNPESFPFRYEIIHGGTRTNDSDPEKTQFLYSGLFSCLNRIRPDHIIVSGFSRASLYTLIWKLVMGTSFSIWSGTIPERGRKSGLLRRLSRKVLVRFTDNFIAYGSLAASYLESIGAPVDSIHLATNTVDTDFFQKQSALERNAIETGIKTTSEPIHFLFTGYLVQRKEPETILEAAQLLKERGVDFRITFVGDGPLKQELMDRVSTSQLNTHVFFAGYVQTDKLPTYLAQADVFLFQTGFDIWGLVLNEAMAAGLPAIASVHAGATPDLVVEGLTGFQIDYRNTVQLADCMAECINMGRDNLRKMGEKARLHLMNKASLTSSARGFVSAVPNHLFSSK